MDCLTLEDEGSMGKGS